MKVESVAVSNSQTFAMEENGTEVGTSSSSCWLYIHRKTSCLRATNDTLTMRRCRVWSRAVHHHALATFIYLFTYFYKLIPGRVRVPANLTRSITP